MELQQGRVSTSRNTRVIVCPETIPSFDRSLFVAGGISNCPDWQSQYISYLSGTGLLLLNPRRAVFERSPEIDNQQIGWEHQGLSGVTGVSFWFPKESLCPITLLELGRCAVAGKLMFVGVDPEYPRRADVEIQLSLLRPEVRVVNSLEQLAQQVREWASIKLAA